MYVGKNTTTITKCIRLYSGRGVDKKERNSWSGKITVSMNIFDVADDDDGGGCACGGNDDDTQKL